MKISIKKAVYCSILLLCAIGLLYQYSSKVLTLKEKKALKNSPYKKIVFGRVSSITNAAKSTRKMIFYNFSYNNERYFNNIMDHFYYKCRFEYKERTFPIVIDSTDPKTNIILFHKRDYVYFGYPVPDSMNWVFKCVVPSGSYIFSPAPISPD